MTCQLLMSTNKETTIASRRVAINSFVNPFNRACHQMDKWKKESVNLFTIQTGFQWIIFGIFNPFEA